MNCQHCGGPTKKFGKDRKGHQRYRCLECKVTFIEPYERPLGDMRLTEEKSLAVLAHLVEGVSVRSTERITGVHRDTILDLLVTVADKCEQMMFERIRGLSVRDVQCDEIWGFIGMKEKTKNSLGKEADDSIGDAWTFIGIERHTKVILALHLGRRTMSDTVAFTEKLAHATSGNFQVTTDGFAPYRDAVVYSLGAQHVDFAQVIKIYGTTEEKDTRYSPSECIGCEKKSVYGNPDLFKATTSHIERQNLTLRMTQRRMTRLTNAFSKKWENHRASMLLYAAHYNFCRVHSSLRVTPAMEQGITDHVWTLRELLAA